MIEATNCGNTASFTALTISKESIGHQRNFRYASDPKLVRMGQKSVGSRREATDTLEQGILSHLWRIKVGVILDYSSDEARCDYLARKIEEVHAFP